jgi:hypothetical protein
VDEAEHVYSETVVKPTCIAKGYTLYQCVCGDSYQDNYVNANGIHVPNENGVCEGCGIIIATKGLVYSLSSDGTYATVTDYNGATKEVVIADTYQGAPVKVIGENAFKDTRITKVVIPDSVTEIKTFAFQNCYSLTDIIIPNNVKTIGRGAFYCCESLASVTISASVTKIDSIAFAYCEALTAVYITDVAAWCAIEFVSSDSNPLYYAKNLYLNNELVENLVIPEGVTVIREWAFYHCESLLRVDIANSVTAIGRSAFENCSNLAQMLFKDSTTWYRTDSYANWTSRTGGTKTTVSSMTTSANYFKLTYKTYYWYKL